MKKVLVYLDGVNPAELLGAAGLIYPEEKIESYGLRINGGKSRNDIFFDNIITATPGLEGYDTVNITNCVEELHKIYNFDCILVPATYFGRMTAPRIAMRLNTGLVADVTGIKNDRRVELIRPTYGGRIMASIECGSKPLMASIREGVFEAASIPAEKTLYTDYELKNRQTPGIKLIEISPKETGADIRESRVLVSGGGGVTNSFHELEKLARLLGGSVSASRQAVDKGVAPRSIQVGQSGKTVSPDLYMALGIYGSLQHIEGLKNVKHIISVNTNKNAPICSLSDIVVEGDAKEFIDKLCVKIESCKDI